MNFLCKVLILMTIITIRLPIDLAKVCKAKSTLLASHTNFDIGPDRCVRVLQFCPIYSALVASLLPRSLGDRFIARMSYFNTWVAINPRRVVKDTPAPTFLAQP